MTRPARPAESEGVLRMLAVLLSAGMTAEEKKRVLQEEYNMLMTSEMEGEASEMCNISEAIEEHGRKEGRREGRKEGRKEGREEGQLRDIASLMETLGLDAQQAMDALKVPPEKRSRYAAAL